MSAKQIVAGYLIIQAAGVAAWWSLLISVPQTIAWFQPEAWSRTTLLGFWLADSLLLVGGSLVAAGLVIRKRRSAATTLWCLAAVVWYPTLYCIGVSIMTDEAWLASAMMASMAGLTLAMATIHGTAHQEPATVRVTPMSKRAAVGWTLAQTLLFWSTLLWIVPRGIVEIEQRLGWTHFSHPFQDAGAICLFLAASVLGLTSGITMATQGDGTPLPTATAPRLVLAGPYRILRNPMAVAGIVQGIAVGWWFGSISVIVYAVVGAVFWHFIVRPFEEADLQARFGESYSRYREAVGLWVPMIWRQSGR